MYEKNLEKYRDRLFGLIDEDKILCTEIPRPGKEVIEEFYKYAGGLTPTVADILDSMGIVGTISASVLKPVIPGKTVIGPVVTLRYLFERKTPSQNFFEKNKGRMADRDAYRFDRNRIGCAGVDSSEICLQRGKAGFADRTVITYSDWKRKGNPDG